MAIKTGFISMLLLSIVACQKGRLKHERYIFNNTSADTIVVINPDFPGVSDTLNPGDSTLIYSFETLDTDQEYEPCKWLGDTLIIKNQANDPLLRSVKTESFWIFTLKGDKDRLQKCIFIISTGDF